MSAAAAAITINLHDLVLVHPYGDDPAWYEVIEIHGDHLICTNGLGDDFRVEYRDVYDVTDSDGPLYEDPMGDGDEPKCHP